MLGDVTRRPPHAAVRAYSAIAYASFAVTTVWAVAFLTGLPVFPVIDGTRYCHASPLSDMRSFLPEPGDDDEQMLAGASERRVVFGHTHLQFHRRGPGGIELLNPGSVGLPLDGGVYCSTVGFLVTPSASVPAATTTVPSAIRVAVG